jgi:hypothetical protein
MTASDVTESDQRKETWKAIPGFPGYEASDNSVWRMEDGRVVQVSGGIRSIDRTVGTRRLKGTLLAGRLNSGRGNRYVMVNMTDGDGNRRTMLAHLMILLAHRGEPGPGQETLHDPKRGPLWCRVPEDMRYGTKKENAADIAAAGTLKTPATVPCVNHDRCGGMVVREGSRCLPCAIEVGKEAAAMLSAGLVLDEVARRLGYKSSPWVEKLARAHGGFTGPLPQARPRPRVRRQPWPQRAVATLRYRLRSGKGDGK